MESASEERLFKRHYPELDLLRAVAITLVMLLHFLALYSDRPSDPLVDFARWGWNGVGLFFALSGFLIGGQIIEEARAGSFNFKRFYFKRFLRIFPPYYFSLLVVAVMYYFEAVRPYVVWSDVGRAHFFKDLLVHIFYLQNYGESVLQYGIYWSLAIEEQFYIIAPVLLLVLLRFAPRAFWAAVAVLIVVALAVRLSLYDPNLFYETPAWEIAYRHPLHTRFDSLLFGVLAAYVYITRRAWLASLSPALKTALFAIALACLCATFKWGTMTGTYFSTTWQFTLQGAGFSLLLLWGVVADFGRYVRPVKLFSFIAKLSYTMYLYHFMVVLIFGVSIRGLVRIDTHAEFLIWFVVYYAVVLVVSAVIYRLVDVPCLSYRKRIVKRYWPS